MREDDDDAATVPAGLANEPNSDRLTSSGAHVGELPLDVDRETESPELGPPSVTPRGWTEDEWKASLYNSPPRRSPWASLNVGKGWLLAVILAMVVVLLVVAVLALHSSL